MKVIAAIFYLFSLAFSLPATWSTIQVANPTVLWAYTVGIVLALVAFIFSVAGD